MTLQAEIKTGKRKRGYCDSVAFSKHHTDNMKCCSRIGIVNNVAYSQNNKVSSLKPNGVKFQTSQGGKTKDIKDKLEGKLRERPEVSYISFFFNQNFSGFLFGRVY